MMYIQEFRNLLSENGLLADEIIADGQLHRCATKTKPDKLNGAYLLHSDKPISGYWKNFETAREGTWCAAAGASACAPVADAAAASAAAPEQPRKSVEETARGVLAASRQPLLNHPYLVKKQIPPVGNVRQIGDNLAISLHDEQNRITGLQIIKPNGEKRFIAGTKKKAAFHVIKGGQNGPLYIVEGWATGVSVHLASGETTLVAFDCENMLHVAQVARKLYPGRKICVVSDNDVQKNPLNPGLEKAREADRKSVV